ncbi:aromatic acid exporter family protein [Fusibacter tunisiensis]|uniref:Uncharacterized membrane protein YgaE (UPF0421/DUF939 family) n=1 Tax=Fusibacter tunisiensis TaxID=1008308 RepID=A0ABS2MP25_9FIRM|nr:aromatic acid exporter family protein [Fusibacter tunisiensis]MBM7561148.1 uncharacterized membrane protein YgaE (UPF0421/DUF939 family) [Fusibacter tunisiensis]
MDRKEIMVKSLKISIGVAVGVIIASALELEFYSSVATIIIVSMLSSKRQSLKLAGKRLMAAVVALLLSSLMFSIFGFSLPVFTVFIFAFTFLMYRFDSKTAIVLNVVLVMHIYALEEISFSILLNELGLMSLGIMIALAMNAFVIDIEAELKGYQKEVEDLFQNIFDNMGKCLVNACTADQVQADLDKLYKVLMKSKERSYQYLNNYYLQENNYYVEYFSMRISQYYTVKRMQKFIKQNFLKHTEVMLLKGFTDQFINNTKILNSCLSQVEALDQIKNHFTYEAELPTSYNQLQNRIALHQYLYALDDLISVKMRFIETHEKK